MSMLSSITTGKIIQPRRCMIYGGPGVGKTTFAAGSENPIFICTEEGTNELSVARFPLAKNIEAVGESLRALRDEDHPYKTVVIDSLDWLERMIWAKVVKDKNVKSIEDIGYGKGYMFAIALWQGVLNYLEELRTKKGMTTVLIAHSKIEKFENPETETYDRYSPRLHKLASALVMEWCDEVLFATLPVMTRSADEGFNQKRTMAMSTGVRVLRTSDKPAHVGKNRLGMPEEIPLAWEEYAKFFTKGG